MTHDFANRPRVKMIEPTPRDVCRKWDEAIWDAQGEAAAKGGSIGFGDQAR